MMTEMISVTIKLTPNVIENLKRKAERTGLSLEEYILELILRDLDPQERAREYIEAAKSLLEQVQEELKEGDLRQAAEKLWGATALTVKAYAEWREGRLLSSHRELWEYRKKLEREIGAWVFNVWMSVNGMHTCFYEGWCMEDDIRRTLEEVKKFVNEVAKRITS